MGPTDPKTALDFLQRTLENAYDKQADATLFHLARDAQKEFEAIRDNDRLAGIFKLQEHLMRVYQERTPDGIPDWPVDLARKSSQRFCRDTISKVQDELFEAKHLLKQAKEHRNVKTAAFDRKHFKEEMIDALHYFVEACVLVGIDANELHSAYLDKNLENHNRIAREFSE